MNKVGIIGCGTIGGELAQKITRGNFPGLTLSFLSDIDYEQAMVLKKKLRRRVRIISTKELIEKSDIIIEAASKNMSFDVALDCLCKGKVVIIMSVGGLIQDVKKLERALTKTKGTLYVPSGAICGIDGVLAAKRSTITSVTLTTRKPVKGLIGAPYFKKKGIRIEKIKKETVVFNGTAKQAIQYFPKNVNVAAILSLASLGVNKTRVKIVTSPLFKRNSHEVCIEGGFGSMSMRTENVPSPTNPKTSYLAILAAEAVLAKMCSKMKLGT